LENMLGKRERNDVNAGTALKGGKSTGENRTRGTL